MIKKLQCLFLMSLLGYASMADSKPNARDGVPQAMRHNMIDKQQKSPSTKSIDDSMTPFRQDIIKHPLLWILFSACSIVFSFGIWALTLLLILDNSNATNTHYLQASIMALFLSPGLYALLSLVTANWASRWVNIKSQKGEEPILPSFQDRFWRSFRFMCSLAVILPIGLTIFMCFIIFKKKKIDDKLLAIVFCSPCIIAILSYVGSWVYDYWQRQKQETKAINKQDPVLPQKGASLSLTNPLAA